MYLVVIKYSGLESEESGFIEYNLDSLLLTQSPECQFYNSRYKVGRYFLGQSGQR